MWFRTKKEVLEYLGKDCKDVRYVNRKVAKGEIKEVDGWYELVDIQWDRLRELEEENKNLKARVKELEEVCKDSLFWDNPAWWDTANELEELKINYEYLHKKFQRLRKGYDLVIKLTYKYAAKWMNITKEEYQEQLADEINEMLGREE